MTTDQMLYLLFAITPLTFYLHRVFQFRKVSQQEKAHSEAFRKLLNERETLTENFFKGEILRETYMRKLIELDGAIDEMPVKQADLEMSLQAVSAMIGMKSSSRMENSPLNQLFDFDMKLSKRLRENYNPTDIDNVLTTMMINFYMTRDDSLRTETQMALFNNGIHSHKHRTLSLGNVAVMAGPKAAALLRSVSPFFEPLDSKTLLDDLERARLHQKLVDQLPPKKKSKVLKI